jgi:hypothetical protein
MKFANDGKTTVCGQWTSEMKTHFKVSVAICSDNDKFNKKKGKRIAENRMIWQFFIVLPANHDLIGLKEQLKDFLYVNC